MRDLIGISLLGSCNLGGGGDSAVLKSPILSFGMFFCFSARGPYDGQQWRQQNATPPSDHVMTSLPPHSLHLHHSNLLHLHHILSWAAAAGSDLRCVLVLFIAHLRSEWEELWGRWGIVHIGNCCTTSAIVFGFYLKLGYETGDVQTAFHLYNLQCKFE